jgi:hypothetical protein
MRAREIHSSAEEPLGEPLLRKSVKGTLSNHAQDQMPRFVPVGRGLFTLAVVQGAISRT